VECCWTVSSAFINARNGLVEGLEPSATAISVMTAFHIQRFTAKGVAAKTNIRCSEL